MSLLAIVATAGAILAGVGLVFGALIAIGHRRLAVWEDPRIEEVAALLPGVNCGACGFPGCRGFAEAVVAGEAKPAGCNVMNDEMRATVAAFLGVDAGQANRRVARLMCAGGDDVATRKAEYVGMRSCAAAVTVGGGGKGCAWGCLGYADCAVSCTFDAIRMSASGLPVVSVDRCTACGDCVEACPLGLFTILPLDAHLIVQCRSLLEGEAATSVCSVACNACGRCVADAAPGLIRMERGLAVVDHDQVDRQNAAAVARCPTGAIAWVEGAQLGARAGTRLGDLVRSNGRGAVGETDDDRVMARA